MIVPERSSAPGDPAAVAPSEVHGAGRLSTLVTLAEALAAVEALLRRFIRFSDPAQPVAITLWIALTYIWPQFETLIYLVITSAVKGSGKTRLFDVLAELVPSPWRVVRPSEAVTYRRLDRDHPTLLLDEYDTIFGDRSGQFEGIRAIFNSGNRRGTTVSRAVAKGKGFDLVDFDICSPKALAGIGPLPDTVADRAIVIRMTRRAPGEQVERLRSRNLRVLAEPIRDALAHHLGELDLSGTEPEMPAVLGDRATDGWEPLIAIADAAGGPWPDRSRRAAAILSADGVAADESPGLTVLADIRTVFAERRVNRLWTDELLGALIAIEESPWGDLRGRPLMPTQLAKLLKPFGIGPKGVRKGEEVKRGYDATDFADAWTRYLPARDADLPPESRYARYSRYTDVGRAEYERGRLDGPVAGVAPVAPVADQPEVWQADRSLGEPTDAEAIAAAWGMSVETDYPRSAWDVTDV